MHTNMPAGGDTTFGMNGGSVSLAWNVDRNFALVGDIGAVHASDVPVPGQGLTVTYYVVGPRYYWRRKSATNGERRSHALTPYGQVLVGAAHASGLLSGSSGGSDSFAMKIGGGVELPLNRRVMLRPAQTEYLLTLFPNNVNARQNNFLFGAGLVVRLGQRGQSSP
jgi:hypothetical protein